MQKKRASWICVTILHMYKLKMQVVINMIYTHTTQNMTMFCGVMIRGEFSVRSVLKIITTET